MMDSAAQLRAMAAEARTQSSVITHVVSSTRDALRASIKARAESGHMDCDLIRLLQFSGEDWCSDTVGVIGEYDALMRQRIKLECTSWLCFSWFACSTCRPKLDQLDEQIITLINMTTTQSETRAEWINALRSMLGINGLVFTWTADASNCDWADEDDDDDKDEPCRRRVLLAQWSEQD